MKKQTVRTIYYISIIISLVTILVCAVIINRTLVNTSEFVYDDSTVFADEPVSAYMVYIDGEGSATVGFADEQSGDAGAVVEFVRGVAYTKELPDANISKTRIPDAWVVLYDKENRMSDRINFYDKGTVAVLNGRCFEADPADMNRLIELCDMNVVKSNDEKASEEELAPEQEMVEND